MRNLRDFFKRKDRSTDDLMRSKSSQNLYVSVMFLSFIAATGISALINVMMFSQLSPLFYEQMVLIAISITLEGTKVLSIFKASVLNSIGQKIDKIEFDQARGSFGPAEARAWKKDRKRRPNQTTKAGRFYFRVYLAFAFIAIFASLGMTLTVTNRTGTETVAATTKTNAVIEKAKSENATYNGQIAALDFSTVKSAYDLAQASDDQLALSLVDLNSKYRASNYTDAVIYNEILTTKAKRTALRLADKKKAYETASAEKARLEALIAANSTLIANSGIALIDVQSADLEKKGTANMFFLMAQFFKFVSEVVLRFIILMVISVLIEVTVYTAAPEININRKILYYFRKYLPEDLDVDLLLYEFDQDLARFSEVGEKKMIVQNEPQPEAPPVVLKPIAKKPRGVKKPEKTPAVSPEQVPVPGPVPDPVPVSPEQVPEQAPEQESVPESLGPEPRVELKPSEPEPEPEPEPEHPEAQGPTETSTQVEEKVFYGKEKKVLPRREKVKEQKAKVEEPKVVEESKVEETEALPKVEEPKAEEPKVEEPKAEEPKISKVSAEVINYRFGKTSEQVKDTLVKYVNAMMAGLDDLTTYPAPVKDPIEVASALGIRDRVRDVLLKRLQDMAFNDVPLMKRNPDGTYVTNFNPMFIEEWTTNVVKS